MPDHRTPGDTTAKGYGAAHQALRRKWAPLVRAGGVACAKCGGLIQPGERWDLGHVPGSQRQAYRGPEHRACNRATAGTERPVKDPAPRPRTRW